MSVAADVPFIAFNRGIVDKRGLARALDIKRIAFAAEIQVNWTPRVLGSMMLRPGLGYIGATYNNAKSKSVPFEFSTSDTARIEFTDSNMRVWINDVLLARVAVATAVTNGTFNGNITGWTDASTGTASTAWAAGNLLQLNGDGTARAVSYQEVAIAGADEIKEHALRVVVNNGPVTMRVGTAQDDDSLIGATSLDTGTFSMVFTPQAPNVWIQFESTAKQNIFVANCTIEPAGTVVLPSPYAMADLVNIRHDQSADNVYLACAGYQQRLIQRRGTRPGARGWGICLYRSPDGPFNVQNVTPTTITPSGTGGNITLTASAPTFKAGDVGSLVSLTASSEMATVSVSAQNTFSAPIMIAGIGAARQFTFTVTGVWGAGKVTVQQSLGVVGNWTDYTSTVVNGSQSLNDGLDNQTVYYQVGIKTGDYVSGTAVCTLLFAAGVQRGITRITGYTDSQHASAEVLTTLGGTAATAIWERQIWSNTNGWPTSVGIYEGRMWWAGQNGVQGSVSDGYVSFDETIIGASGPIIRTIGSGPVDTINWIIPLQRLMLGAQGSEFSCRSDSFDDPLSPSNFNLKASSTQGSANTAGLKVDSRGIYVQRGGVRVFQLEFDLRTYDYASTNLTEICPELGLPGIVCVAVQRQPDTRIHCVRSDGVVMVGVIDEVENVICWYLIQTNGVIEDVCVLPSQAGELDDQVYYTVARQINGTTARYHEKMAQEIEARGTTINKQADAFVAQTFNMPQTVITGLGALEGQPVTVWADGNDVGTTIDQYGTRTQTYTVRGGAITLLVAATNVVVGLYYSAQWQSGKASMSISGGETALTRLKKIYGLGLVLADTHPLGLQFGPDFGHLSDMPLIEGGEAVNVDQIWSEYDFPAMEFDGGWITDARLCLQAASPRPCTITAAVPQYEMRTGG